MDNRPGDRPRTRGGPRTRTERAPLHLRARRSPVGAQRDHLPPDVPLSTSSWAAPPPNAAHDDRHLPAATCGPCPPHRSLDRPVGGCGHVTTFAQVSVVAPPLRALWPLWLTVAFPRHIRPGHDDQAPTTCRGCCVASSADTPATRSTRVDVRHRTYVKPVGTSRLTASPPGVQTDSTPPTGSRPAGSRRAGSTSAMALYRSTSRTDHGDGNRTSGMPNWVCVRLAGIAGVCSGARSAVLSSTGAAVA